MEDYSFLIRKKIKVSDNWVYECQMPWGIYKMYAQTCVSVREVSACI